jgi:hypothetical protein
MSRRLTLAFLSVIFVYGLSIGFAPRPALADSCDNELNACFSKCGKRAQNLGDVPGNANLAGNCGHDCMITNEERKKKGQCKQAAPVSWR